MKIKHILLNQDGVLADFQAGALRCFGYEIGAETDKGVKLTRLVGGPKLYPFGEWSIPSVLGLTNSKFWRNVESRPYFFTNLEPLEDARELMQVILDSGIPFTICTSPSLGPQSAAGKIVWMRKFLDLPNFKDYMIGSQKWLMSNPGHLLIDDSPKNCRDFRRRNDGEVYLWPQYWNEGHAYRRDRVAEFKKFLVMK